MAASHDEAPGIPGKHYSRLSVKGAVTGKTVPKGIMGECMHLLTINAMPHRARGEGCARGGLGKPA